MEMTIEVGNCEWEELDKSLNEEGEEEVGEEQSWRQIEEISWWSTGNDVVELNDRQTASKYSIPQIAGGNKTFVDAR